MDFFGHVEFRNKESLISETRRVLRRGGAAIHGVETGSIDYFEGDPSDENNPIRKYVWIDGHIGVETSAETIQRFARHFRIERALPMIHPFHQMPEMLDWGTFSDEFRNTFLAFDEPTKNVIANVMTRALYDHCFKRLHHNSRKAISSRVFLRDDSGNEIELGHGGFTMISMIERLSDSI